MSNHPHIAVVSINRDKYSETFIQNAFDSFPSPKTLLYGDYLPTHSTGDWKIEGQPIPSGRPAILKEVLVNPDVQRTINLRKWLIDHRPDVLLCNYGPSAVALTPLCAELRIPMVVHFHGYDAFRSDVLESYGRQYPEMFARASWIVAVSQAMKDQLIRLGAPPEKICTYIYGVDLQRFSASPLPSDSPNFLFVGRFVEKKAPNLLVRAFARVIAHVPEAQLTLVGDGELHAECIRIAEELQLGNSIRFTGARPAAEIVSFLAAALALVLPSVRTENGDSEGTPLVILEAAACGRPVIATRHGGIPDVVVDEESGILIQENDESALADAMVRMANDRQMAESMGKNARHIAQQRFGQETYHQKLFEILQDAIALAQNS